MNKQPSILDLLIADTPFPVRSQVVIRDEPVLAVGLDNGNDAAKLAVLDPNGKMITKRIPTAHQLSRPFQSGPGEVTFRVGDDSSIWIGEAALRNEGRALRVGSTATRLADKRHISFLAASLVELLHEAGYPPGAYTLAIGFAIPNNELVKDDEGDKLVVLDETKQALRRLQDAVWTVARTDERGTATSWQLTVRRLMPQAQSLGTFVSWAKAPTGQTVTDYDAVTVLDVGGGDLQRTDISIRPQYRMTSERRGNGTIDIARALVRALPKAQLNDVTAQAALVSKQALISGKMQKIDREVNAMIGIYGSDLAGKLLEVFQDSRRFLVITGGGVILLADAIRDLLGTAGKEAGQDYEIVPQQYASTLNAVGTLFPVIFASGKK